MPLISYEINLMLTWFPYCAISNSTDIATFAITDTNQNVPVITLSTQDNTKLLQQLKSAFKTKINWNKYQSEL